MKYFIIIAISLGIMTGCNNNRTAHERTDLTSADVETIQDRSDYNENDNIDSLGYYGVFEGTLPAPNSRTVKAKITLYNNNRYTIHSADIDDNTRTEEEQGTFLIFGDLLTLTPDNNGGKHYYRTGEDDIVRVNENKEEVPGIHAENFRLYRSQD